MNTLFRIICLFILIIIYSCGGSSNNNTINNTEVKKISSTFINEEICILSDIDQLSQFKELDQLNIDTIILNNIIISTSEGEFRYICNYSKREVFNIINRLYEYSIIYNKKLYLGLVNGMFVKSDYFNEPNSTYVYNKTIELLNDLKNNNITKIEGFYIPDEPALGCWDIHDQIILHYSRINKIIKDFYKDKKVIVSPYFCYQRKSIEQVAMNTKKFLEKTDIDILAFQDGVGAYTDLKDIDLVSKYFKEINKSVPENKLQILIELFEDMCSYTCNNPNYNATNINRLKEQINKLTIYGSKTTCQSQTHHLSEIIPTSIFYKGDKLKQDYIYEFLK